MPRDLRAILQWQHPHSDRPSKGEIAAYCRAYLRVVLADAVGKDDEISTTQYREHASDLLGNRAAEHADGECGGGVVTGMQHAQVGRQTRHLEQA